MEAIVASLFNQLLLFIFKLENYLYRHISIIYATVNTSNHLKAYKHKLMQVNYMIGVN